MKANELMIGDWVMVKDYPIMPLQLQVQPEHFVRSLVEFEPIPITPEILEKNGFKKQGFDGWEIDHKTDNGNDLDWLVLWRNDYSIPHLLIDSFVSLYGSFSSFGINYVHELQHAFKLCGIKLEIKL